MPKKRAIIFANGDLPDLEAARHLIRPDDTLIAADGGTRHALALGLHPALIIGDLDSLTVDDRQWAVERGARLLQYPANKDETDLELVLNYAVKNGFREIVILAALGARLDQTLGNLALLTGPELANVDIRLDDGVEEVWFARGRSEIHGRTGDTVSLIPWGGEVTGVTTEGLRWPLHCETLYPDQTRGISNEMLAEAASISIGAGLLLISRRRNSQSSILNSQS